MATTTQKSYEVASVNNWLYSAFILFDYERREAIASAEYDGGYRKFRYRLKAKEGLEYAAIERVADMLDDATNGKVIELECLVDEVSSNVDAYLYSD